MKLYIKISLCIIGTVTLTLSAFSYLMISLSFNRSLDREEEQGLGEYQMLKYTLQSEMQRAEQDDSLTDEVMDVLVLQTAQVAPSDSFVAIHLTEGTLLYSDFPFSYSVPVFSELSEGEVKYSVQKMQSHYFLILFGRFNEGGQELCLSVARNVNDVFEQKSQMESIYHIAFWLTVTVSSVIALILSVFLTRPIKRLKKASIRIADGKYAERVTVNTRDEIGELGADFNRMAETIEEKIRELELTARQREDFVANFAHELKTPLTSIIGYADMIYQRDLEKERIKSAAGYILNEGMRLEALSFKLLDLIVMNKQDFVLEEIEAQALAEDLCSVFAPRMEEQKIDFRLDVEAGNVWIEYDLMKTLMVNLIDNAVKAGAGAITLEGRKTDDGYAFCIEDNGCGMAKEELERITEAFYMVDKSRSRQQHGAGLGLALAAKIADLHETVLQYHSMPSVGTAVTFVLPDSHRGCFLFSQHERAKDGG